MKILHYKKSLHFIATLISIVAMSHLASWFWQNIETQNSEISANQPAIDSPKKKSEPIKTVNHDLRDILSADIFNQNKMVKKIIKKVVKANIQQKEILKTRQPLFLHGIISSSDPARSISLISNKNSKSPLPYMQGDSLPNTAGIVHLIFNDYVLIKHNDRLEKLELLKQKNTKLFTKDVIKHRIGKRKISSLKDIKSHYKNNRAQFLSRFGLIKTGNGIKLSTKKGKLPPGLRDGDVIISVNGYSWEDLEANLSLLDRILKSDKVEASLERNGRIIHFNVPKAMFEKLK
jgi:type II secretion system protein C